jgi:hypothetical protein
VVVDALFDQDATRCVQGQHLAAGLPMRDARAHWHGTLLVERGGEAALLESGQGSRGVVAENDNGVGEVEFKGGSLKGQDPSEGLPADLMAHVARVREGADDDFAFAVGPPAEDHAPAMQRGVPRDDNDVSVTSVTGEEGSVERAGDKGPQGAAGESVVFEDPANEESRLRDGGGEGDGEVGVKLVLGTEDGRKRATNGRTYGRHAE